jgi:uncharacterized protein YoxC
VLKTALDFGKQLLSLMKDVQQNKSDIKELRQELKEVRQELRDLVTIVQQLAFRIQQNHENERYERELLLLRVENRMLRHQQSLSPAEPPQTASDKMTHRI